MVTVSSNPENSSRAQSSGDQQMVAHRPAGTAAAASVSHLNLNFDSDELDFL